MTYIYVMPIHENYNGYGFLENGGLPPPQPPENEPPEAEEKKPTVCSRLLSCCKCCKKKSRPSKEETSEENDAKAGCFSCSKRKKTDSEERINIPDVEATDKKTKCWDRLKCCSKNGAGRAGCCSKGKHKESWAERRDSILSEPVKRSACSRIFRKIFCLDSCRCCKKKEDLEEHFSRRESMLSKKKSLTPTVLPEEPKPKIDISLVEHSSIMKGAIPILPVALAWFCLVFNVILPGSGTIFSGMFCLCLGKPRFSQNDGIRPRLGSFIINLIIGVGQLFTVLFCLVGWGWSIWWGVIMLKVAKKHRKIKIIEAHLEESAIPVVNQNHNERDAERGS